MPIRISLRWPFVQDVTVADWPVTFMKLAITVYFMWAVGWWALLLCALMTYRRVTMVRDKDGHPVFIERRRRLWRRR